MHMPVAQLLKLCTRHYNHAHRVQGAPLISNTEYQCRISAFSVKYCECKIEKRDSHLKSRNGHGKVIKSDGTMLVSYEVIIL